jgi:hypothetical protein
LVIYSKKEIVFSFLQRLGATNLYKLLNIGFLETEKNSNQTLIVKLHRGALVIPNQTFSMDLKGIEIPILENFDSLNEVEAFVSRVLQEMNEQKLKPGSLQTMSVKIKNMFVEAVISLR